MTTDIERGGIDVGGSHEPSYYEIALTNRQVVVAFVVLLTCVVAAFFSGVWIGRESAARAQERLALLGRGRAVDGVNADADKGKQEGQALQEFKFFADSRQRPAAARVDRATSGAAGSHSEGSTLADDLHHAGGSVASVASAAPHGNAVVAAAPRAASAAAEAAGEGEPLPGTTPPAAGGAHASHASRASASSAKGASTAGAGSGKAAISWSPAASATETSDASAAAAAAQPSRAAASAAAGEVVIQVFSTADKEQADKVRDGLVHAGFTALLSPIAKGGQTMYRVRIGPFSSRNAAEPVAEKVRKERKLDTWITPK